MNRHQKPALRSVSLAAVSTFALFYGAPGVAFAQEASSAQGDEIIVTATRRAESVQDIPYNLSALGAADVERLGLTDLSDIARTVPGLAFVDVGPRNNGSTILRGLSVDPIRRSDGGDNGSVATYINDTPVAIQPKLLDVERIEVLRGPQGTLYGSGSLGGAIRYLINDANPAAFAADASAKTYKIDEANAQSYEVSGMINIPLATDKAAVRIATTYLNDSGFTDYPYIIAGPQQDVDYEKRITTRLSAFVAPIAPLSITASYYIDDSDSGGRTGGNPGYRRLPTVTSGATPGQNTASYPASTFARDANRVLGDYDIGLRYEEPRDARTSIGALEVKYELGFADLTSSTSRVVRNTNGQRDQTDLLLGLGFGYENYPDFRAFTREDAHFDAFVEELRLVSTTDSRLSYVVGLYYNKEKTDSSSIEFTPGFAPFIGATRTDDIEYYQTDEGEFEETAVFGELSLQLTDAWQITAGGRYFQLKDDTSNCTALPIYDDPNSSNFSFSCTSGQVDVKDSTFKFNTSYDVTDEVLLYATFSQGFRRGGPNNLPNGGQFVGVDPSQLSYDPDTVDNTEIGIRSRWLDKRLTVNAAIYNIDWKDVQVASLAPGNLPIIANAGEARSRGLELEASFQATDALSFALGYSHVKAELTADYLKTRSGGAIIADFRSGTRLPGAPEDQVNAAVDYVMPFDGYGELTLHADGSYSSDITTSAEPFRGATPQEDYRVLDGYALLNLAVILDRDDGWRGRVFMNNVAGEYAYVAQQGPATYGAQGQFFVPIRPRIIGVEIGKKF